MLTVVDSNREPIAGSVEIDPGEQRWSFRPVAAWPPSAKLVVDGALEDPCGNRIGVAFDLDLNNPEQAARRNAARKQYEFPVPLRTEP